MSNSGVWIETQNGALIEMMSGASAYIVEASKNNPKHKLLIDTPGVEALTVFEHESKARVEDALRWLKIKADPVSFVLEES